MRQLACLTLLLLFCPWPLSAAAVELGDGRLDLLVNSRSVDWMKNVSGGPDRVVFGEAGRLDPRRLAGHTASPTVVDWDRDGVCDLLLGAEDGFLYYLKNPHAIPLDGQTPSGPAR